VPLTSREVKQALLTKGFLEDRQRDHRYYFFHYAGKKSQVYTKISHGAREIDDSLCSMMARQMKLNTSQFRNFVDCCLSEEMYAQILINCDLLPRS